MAPPVVAAGRPASVELARLEKASFEEACAAELSTPIKPHEHPLPTCFVCGPARAKGDGLRIFAGPLGRHSQNAVLAASWIPDPNLAAEDGLVAPEFLWSALDCPTGYALQLQSAKRQLRAGTAAAVGTNVGTDRGTAASWRTLRHHGLADRPRRTQTRRRGRSPRRSRDVAGRGPGDLDRGRTRRAARPRFVGWISGRNPPLWSPREKRWVTLR